jgi:DNA-binding CsgD family transcriptional regulator/N-acetylneuraminic acid mutarotase
MTSDRSTDSRHDPVDGHESHPLSENPLSEREMEVARLLATGASNAEIARELVISPHTAKVHLRNIFEKLQVNSRTEASMLLVQRGWIAVPGVNTAPRQAEGVDSLQDDASAQTVVAPLPLAEPAPLDNLPASIAGWQRIVFVIVSIACLIAIFLPAWRSQAYTSPPLLSDAGNRGEGAPEIVLEPRWEVRTPLPSPRSRLAVVRSGETLYALGGETTGGRLLGNVDAYDLAVNRWRSMRPLPQPTSNLGAAVLGDYIYVAGGNHAPSNDDGDLSFGDVLWRYSLTENRWEEIDRLPGPLAGAALVADDSTLYLVGGWDGQEMHDEIWSYTPGGLETEQVNWQLRDRLATPRAFLGATIVDTSLYVAGGFDGQRELADAYVLDLSESSWRRLPDMTNPRSGLALVYDGLAIFALGGGWLAPVDAHERYDPAIDVWSNFPSPVPNEWRNLAATAYDGRLLMLGGWSGDYLDSHLQYQSSFRALLPVITSD